MARRGPFFCDPTARGRCEPSPRFHGFDTLEIAHKLWSDPKNHRGLPLARVTHFALAQAKLGEARRVGQIPIRREEEQQIVALPVSLTDFEDRLLAGNIIPAMTVDEHEPPEAVLNKILEQTVQQIEIRPRRRRQRSRKIKVMIRV